MAYTYGTSRKALRPTTPDQEQPAPKLAPVVQAEPKPEPAPKPVRPLKPCGTNAAYVRHFKRHEDPCAACTEARREYVAEHRKSRTRRRAEAKCGTYPGAVRHYRNKEPACSKCKQATNAYRRAHRATKKAA